jgi:hypothetical protein
MRRSESCREAEINQVEREQQDMRRFGRKADCDPAALHPQYTEKAAGTMACLVLRFQQAQLAFRCDCARGVCTHHFLQRCMRTAC